MPATPNNFGTIDFAANDKIPATSSNRRNEEEPPSKIPALFFN